MNAQSLYDQIVPKPHSAKIEQGSFNLSKGSPVIKLQGTGIQPAVKLIQDAADAVTGANTEKSGLSIKINLGKLSFSGMPSFAKEEAYSVKISANEITVTAETPKGTYYAALTLVQLIEKSGGVIPCGEIQDWPDMQFRGISDDLSRGQVSTLPNFKKIIDFISRYKMNVYMPYLEDMVQLKSYPNIGKNRGALTPGEIKELVAYAKERYVEVIPIYQTLGHYENILAEYEFLKYAEFPGAASLNVSNEETYVFLEKMLKEVFELFPTEYFNMGADESYDVGLGASKRLVDASDLGQVHLNHYKRVYDICKKYGKKVWMYGDVILNHPEILKDLPKDITIVDWHYRAQDEYPSTEIFKESGHNYLVSPSVWNFQTLYPAQINALPNIEQITLAGLKNGALGMINSNWGDYGAETIKELLYFGYAWGAQCSWNYYGSELGKFSESFYADFFGVEDDRFAFINHTLSEPLNQLVWHSLWRSPLLPPREAYWYELKADPVVRMAWLDMSIPSLRKAVYKAGEGAVKNKDHFKILEFVVDMLDYYKYRLQTQQAFKLAMDSSYAGDYSEIKVIAKENIKRLTDLKKRYETIWLTYYKPEGLSLIDAKFDRLMAYFEEAETLAGEKALKGYDHTIPSKWAYAKTDAGLAKSAAFTYKFNLPSPVDSAKAQLIADTRGQLYVNGSLIGEVYVRRSLSLVTEEKRILYTDISKYLKAGENEIRVEADNYNRTGFAGFNFISEVYAKSGVTVIKSGAEAGWTAKLSDGKEAAAVEQAYPYTVIAPNFKTNRPSWIER
jgi:hypothetical protein